MDVISLGAGVQSSTLLLMACHGELQHLGLDPKVAIFSDTGWEPKAVYDHLEWLMKESAKLGIEVIVTQKGSIRQGIIDTANGENKRFASIPYFIKDPATGKIGLGRRQCTREYKIEPVTKTIRELLGYKPRQRVKERVRVLMGISLDEVQRMKPNRTPWIDNTFPLIDMGMTRMDCLNWMERKGYPRPPKSSCVGCPYHSNAMWRDMKRNDPEAWEDAVYIDKLLRHQPKLAGEVYMHRSCKPLDEVDLQEGQEELDLFQNECEGMCGV